MKSHSTPMPGSETSRIAMSGLEEGVVEWLLLS